MMGILSQGICISNNHIVHFKYTTILFANYTSVKPKNIIKHLQLEKE